MLRGREAGYSGVAGDLTSPMGGATISVRDRGEMGIWVLNLKVNKKRS